MIKVKRSIGFWITGFSDGESWFFARPLLRKYRRDYSIQISFHIKLRSDDRETLEEINKYFKNIGKINEGKVKQGNGFVTLDFWGADKCKEIIKHFDNYPLKSKKKKDYEVWKVIVEKVANKEHLKNRESFIEVVKLCDKLRLTRLYPGKPIDGALKETSGHNKLYIEQVKNVI